MKKRSGDYTYRVNDDYETAAITEFNHKICGDIIIPKELDGYTVTCIARNSFEGCKNLIRVTIPDSITSIGKNSFWDCTNLKSIVIPDSVNSFGKHAFKWCESLVSIVIPHGVVKINRCVFYGCSNLKNITIPSSVTKINDSAFELCENLTDIFYTGSQEQWDQIKIGSENDCLTKATIHYNNIP